MKLTKHKQKGKMSSYKFSKVALARIQGDEVHSNCSKAKSNSGLDSSEEQNDYYFERSDFDFDS